MNFVGSPVATVALRLRELLEQQPLHLLAHGGHPVGDLRRRLVRVAQLKHLRVVVETVVDACPAHQNYSPVPAGYSSSHRMPGLLRRFGLRWTLQPASLAWATMRATHSNGGANAGTTPSGCLVSVCAPMTTQSNIDRSVNSSGSRSGSRDSHLTATPSICRKAFSAIRTRFCSSTVVPTHAPGGIWSPM